MGERCSYVMWPGYHSKVASYSVYIILYNIAIANFTVYTKIKVANIAILVLIIIKLIVY